VYAALTIASRKEAARETIVVILADTGERHITSRLFAEDTLKTWSEDLAALDTKF
jgi:hypothetical protein